MYNFPFISRPRSPLRGGMAKWYNTGDLKLKTTRTSKAGMPMFEAICKKLLGRKIWKKWRRHKHKRLILDFAKPYFEYDMNRFIRYSGAFGEETRGKLLTKVIMLYHVIEKGLTMPNRRLWFGKDALAALIAAVDRFEGRFGGEDPQIRHAIGVVQDYHSLHRGCASSVPADFADCWAQIEAFAAAHADVPPARQLHCRRESVYGKKNSPFPDFARARRTIRHYAPVELPMQRIRDAVELAMTAPSACNRQYCRVHCLADKSRIRELLAIQGGCRGFGDSADKVLVVTADLEGIDAPRERDDIFTNGGIFLMNLCYSLFYNEVAHCILNWSRTPEEDMAMRKIVHIRDSETVVAVLACGVPPDEFDVAASPRKDIADVLQCE